MSRLKEIINKQSRNTLPYGQRYKLMKYVEENADKITSPDAVRKASRFAETILNFRVTEANVNACRKDLGIKFANSSSGEYRGGRQRDISAILAKSIIRLYDEFSITVPDELKMIANHRRIEPEVADDSP